MYFCRLLLFYSSIKNHSLKLHVSKKTLYFFAGILWLIGGNILLYKGIRFFIQQTNSPVINIFIGICLGLAFFFLMFKKIAFRYINRIRDLSPERLPFYSFFSPKGYLIVAFMISMSISLRMSGIIPVFYMAFIHLFMGIPLTISSVLFLYSGIKYKISYL